MAVWCILLVIFFLVMSTEYFAWRTGVPTVASFRPARRKMIEVLEKYAAPSGAEKPYAIIDLGSGHGQLAAKIARVLPWARVTGIEISLAPWMIASLRRTFFGPPNLEFLRTDFWSFDCAGADAIILFLTANVLDRVSRKLRAELKSGALIVSNECPLTGDWKPCEIADTDLAGVKIFVYRQS